MAMSRCVVRWQDGSHDNNRTCEVCGLSPVDHSNSSTCQYPVYKDYYKEVVTRKTYWDYMADVDPDGEFAKVHAIDPDTLIFRKRHTGAEIHDEYSE